MLRAVPSTAIAYVVDCLKPLSGDTITILTVAKKYIRLRYKFYSNSVDSVHRIRERKILSRRIYDYTEKLHILDY